MCDPISAGLTGLATVGSAWLGSKASSDAADAYSAAANKASDVEWAMYNQSREDMAPWLEAGENALNTLVEKTNAGPGEYTKSDGYQFRLDEGNKNILSRASANGRYNSGATDKELVEYGQNYATNDYDNFLNRYYQSLMPYQSLSGTGQTTATNTASLNSQTASNVGNYLTQAGESRASGYINQANALTGGINNALGLAAITYGGKGWGA